MTFFEKKNRKKFSRIKLLNDLKKEYEISDEDVSRKKMFQYSKVITTIILITTLCLNVFYFIYIVPKSGNLSITDYAMQYSASVLKIWDGGTIIFFCGYFAKSLFETKFERDNEFLSQSLLDKVKQEADEVMDEINS